LARSFGVSVCLLSEKVLLQCSEREIDGPTWVQPTANLLT
jgi:hypothetical protein